MCYCSKLDNGIFGEKARSNVYMRSDYYPGALVAIAGNHLSLINTKEKFNNENIKLFMDHINMMCETCRTKLREAGDVQWEYALDELMVCSMVVEKVKELHDGMLGNGVMERRCLAQIVECLLSVAYLQPRLRLFIVNILLDESDPLYKRTYNCVMNPMHVYDGKYYDKDIGSWKVSVN